MFAFTRKVDARSFKILCTILAEGMCRRPAGAWICRCFSENDNATVAGRREGISRNAGARAVAEESRTERDCAAPLNEAVLQEKTETTDTLDCCRMCSTIAFNDR
jgi:hypothetical protein